MTRKTSALARICSAGALFIAAFALLGDLTAQVQQKGSSQPFMQPSPAHAQLESRTFILGTAGAPGTATNLAQSTTNNSAEMASDGSLFLPATTYRSGGQFAWALAVADVNGDGKPDVVVANADTGPYGSVGVLLGYGNGTFHSAMSYSSGGSGAVGIAVADLRGDGKLDVVVANEGCTGIDGNCVGVLLGNGDGTFQPAVTYADGGSSWASGFGIGIPVLIADVNGDGIPDLVITGQTNPSFGDGTVGVLLGNGDGTFKPVVAYDSGGFGTLSVAAADLNGDGKPDLIAVSCGPSGSTDCSVGTVGVLLGNGNGTFQPVRTYSSGGVGGLSSPVVVADVNGDGKPDLIVGNNCPGNCTGDASVGVLFGNGNGTFQAAVTYDAGGTGASSIVAADLNGEGKLDLVVANGAVGVFLGNGNGTFQPVTVYPASGGTGQVLLADLTGDGKLDVIGINGTSGSADVRLGNGDGTFQALQTYGLGSSTDSIGAVASLEGGGPPDLLSANVCHSNCYINGEVGTIGVLLNNSVVKSVTSTTLTSILNPSIYGQKVTWTATVTTSGSQPPTGKVSFTWTLWGETYTIGTATLNSSGVATLTKSNLNADLYPMNAVYGGDANNLGSSSPILNQTVAQTTSTATLSSSSNPSTQGQSVTFTAKITSPTTTPTGPVTFTAGKTVLGSVELTGGKATFTTSTLPAGSNTITVTYPWNSDIAESSASLTQVVQP